MNKREYKRIMKIKAYNKRMKEKYPINKELRKDKLKEMRESQKNITFQKIHVEL